MRKQDAIGIGLSGLCMVHCLALPVLLSLAPALAWMESEWTHLALAGLALVVGVFAMRTWLGGTRGLILRCLAAAGRRPRADRARHHCCRRQHAGSCPHPGLAFSPTGPPPSALTQVARGATGDCRRRENGDPGAIRTRDLRIRNPLLYPAELRGQPGLLLTGNARGQKLSSAGSARFAAVATAAARSGPGRRRVRH